MSLPEAPLRVHGSEVSYFTGKLEGYLRYKELPYERVPATPHRMRRKSGAAQIPAVELADGRWATDTTAILAWLETERPDPPVVPREPLLAFFCRLLEDYGDEWLWRPAMHYRWSYVADAALLSRKLVDELAHEPLPGFLKRFVVRTRQRTFFVRRDGVDDRTRAHVEATYRGTLARLRDVLADRPFLLGTAPSLADYGFFGPMFRHFGQDPTPSTIMRETAPEVYAWVARVWNARASRIDGGHEAKVPDAWGPLLDEIGRTHLEHLAANARAFAEGRKRFDVEIQGVRYRDLRTARYRVACLESLRGAWESLPDAARGDARARLERHGCWEPLWRVEAPPSGLDLSDPFAGGASMTGYGE
jgi:glutathione S-transferase